MKGFRGSILTFFVIILFVCCCSTVDDDTGYDIWLKWPLHEGITEGINLLPSSAFIEKEYREPHFVIQQLDIEAEIIKDIYKDEYVSLLQSHEYIEITKKEANRISFNAFNGISKKYLVVRAIYPIYGGIYRVFCAIITFLFFIYVCRQAVFLKARDLRS